MTNNSSPIENVVQSRSRFVQLIFDAVSGKAYDYTQGSIRRAVIMLAIPMVLEMLMESIVAVVIGISMAVTAIVARRIGENNPAAAAATAGQVLWIGVAIGTLVARCGKPQNTILFLG